MNPSMTYGPDAVNLVKTFERCRLTSYQDSGGVWTIGWGHTGDDVCGVRTINQEEADLLRESDMGIAERWVNQLVTHPLTFHQFDALVDFVFNLGPHAFMESTLRRYINSGLFTAAAQEFPKWVHQGVKVLPGLVARRAAEQALFNS
jgi:lysozyme